MKCSVCGSEDMYLQSSGMDTSGIHEYYKCPHCNCVVTVDRNPFTNNTTVICDSGIDDDLYGSAI